MTQKKKISAKRTSQIALLKKSKVGKLISKYSTSPSSLPGNDEVIVEPKGLLEVIEFLKSSPDFEYHILLSICGVDYPKNQKRFEVIYNLLSVTKNRRLRVVVQLDDSDFAYSISSIFKSAMWYEREVWDLYGVKFAGNDDLRRILTDYGFEGHPLRKDFPLTGFKEVRYDDELQKVVYEDVYLTQEYRDFDTLSPWEGVKPDMLPGDEKATK